MTPKFRSRIVALARCKLDEALMRHHDFGHFHWEKLRLMPLGVKFKWLRDIVKDLEANQNRFCDLRLDYAAEAVVTEALRRHQRKADADALSRQKAVMYGSPTLSAVGLLLATYIPGVPPLP